MNVCVCSCLTLISALWAISKMSPFLPFSVRYVTTLHYFKDQEAG